MVIGALTVRIQLPGCASLKEKRSRIKPLLARLHREFNLSTAEVERQDQWKEAEIACVMVSNEAAQVQRALQTVTGWIDQNWPDGTVVEDRIELLT